METLVQSKTNKGWVCSFAMDLKLKLHKCTPSLARTNNCEGENWAFFFFLILSDKNSRECGLRKFCQYEVSSDHSCQVSVNPPRYWAAPTRLHLPREHLHVTGLQHSLHYAMHVSIVQCRARTLASIAGQDCGRIVQRSTRVHTTIYKGALFRVLYAMCSWMLFKLRAYVQMCELCTAKCVCDGFAVCH